MSRYLPSLTGPTSGNTVTKMSSSNPKSAIFVGDPAETVRAKMRGAWSGGAQTRQEQTRAGIVEEARVEGDVAVQVLRHFDTDGYEGWVSGYREGRVLSVQIKERASHVITDLLSRMGYGTY
jgi:tryptophanyl-tRNA synthetase